MRNDGKRLRVKLSATTRELQDNGGCLVDGRAELDEEFSKRLIGVTQRGDAWIKALQNTIKEMKTKKKRKIILTDKISVVTGLPECKDCNNTKLNGWSSHCKTCGMPIVF